MEITRARKSKLSIELAPLIDVVFQLLVFFMLASTFAKPAIELTLPKAKTKDQQIQEKVVVGISLDEELTINGFDVTWESFINDLKLRLDESKNTAVHIKGDKSVPYGTFVRIVDLTRRAGAEHVNLVHEEVE